MDLVLSPRPTNEKEDSLSNSLFKRAKTPANKTTTKLKSYNPKKKHTPTCSILQYLSSIVASYLTSTLSFLRKQKIRIS